MRCCINLFAQESVSIEAAAEGVNGPHPVAIWNGTSCFLIVEKMIICSVPSEEAAVAVLAAYYNLNIAYPKGCKNLGIMLDI